MRWRSRLAAVVPAVLAVGGLAPVALAGSALPAQPSISAISPLAGRPTGGGTVTIRGTSLGRVTAVSFGRVRTRQITRTSAHHISVVVPAHAVGAVRVRLVVHGAAGADSANYRYAPPPTQLHWSRDRTIDPDVGDLAGLSCPTRTFCASVEASFTAPALLTFAPHGRAHRSRIGRQAGVPAVSCSSAALCFAVFRNGTLRRWDGRRWSDLRRLASARADLEELSCVTGTPFCLAVGGTGATWVHRRSGWSRAAKPPREAYDSTLSCAAAGFCILMASGRAFRFDGSQWHAASNGLPPDLQSYSSALSCTSPSFCLLTGEGENFRWTGARWHSSSDGFARYGDALACASPHLCLLTHEDGSATMWRDGHWHKAHSLRRAGLRQAAACPDRHECLATIRSGIAFYRPSAWSSHFIERSGGDLSDVSCESTTWCMAVDGYGNALRQADGEWQRPHPIDRRRALSAVSCAARDFCVAVDGADTYDRTTTGAGHAVVYRNGHWRAPAVIDSQHGLTDVACASDRMCIAVDDAGNALRWNGQDWSPPRRAGAEFAAVACPTPSRCIAVGRHSAVWHDGRWAAIHNPAGATQLTDVTCTDSHYCVAGGDGGFYVRHAGVWSGAIRAGRYLWQVLVACISRQACFGSQDNQVDVWDYVFDGSRATYASDEIYGPKMSCTPSGCVAVSLDYTDLGRPVHR